MTNPITKLYKKTDSFIIQPFSLDYTEDIFRELTMEVCKYLRILPAKHIDDTKSFILNSIQKVANQETAQVVITDLDGNFIGQMGVLELNTATPELGLWFKKGVRGKGYASKAMAELVNRTKENKDFDYLRYLVCVDNVGSRKVAERLGAELQVDENGNEITFLEKTRDPDKILTSVAYRIYKK